MSLHAPFTHLVDVGASLPDDKLVELPEDGDLDLVVGFGQVTHHLLQVLVTPIDIILGSSNLHEIRLLACV